MRAVWGVVLAVVFLLPLSARGQEWDPEQQEVWSFIVESWEADTAEDIGWIDQMVHPNFRGWDTSYPMPRDRDTARKWSRYGDESSNTLLYSVFPVSIVVQGNTAVVLYYGSIVTEDLKGDRETAQFREVDVLVREGGEWKFLAWMGADELNPGG